MTSPSSAEPTHAMRSAPAIFWRWWTSELAGMLPSRWRLSARRKLPCLRLSLSADQTVLTACTKSGNHDLGKSAEERGNALSALDQRRYRSWPIIVELDDALGLSKVVDLPEVSQDDLGRLIYYELDRLTPFRPDDVSYAWRVLEPVPGSGRLSVRLEMAPKSVIEEALVLLRQHGCAPARIQLKGDGDREQLDLTPQSPTKTGQGQTLARLLPALVIGLAIIAVAMPIRQQRLLIHQLEGEVASARGGAEASARLREQITELADQANFLTDEWRRHVSMTALLKTLTRLIPDHAYVSQLSVQNGLVTFVGHADKASDLLAMLDSSSLFASPRFRSPVTRDPRTKKERFQIAVDIVRGGP